MFYECNSPAYNTWLTVKLQIKLMIAKNSCYKLRFDNNHLTNKCLGWNSTWKKSALPTTWVL